MKPSRSKAAAGLLALLLAGCGPNAKVMLEKHDLPLPEASWSGKVVESEPDLQKGKTLTLDRAVAIALLHHPDGVASRSVAEAASARVGEALSSYLPQATVTGSWSRSTSNSWSQTADTSGTFRITQGSDASTENLSEGISASQLVLDAGGTMAAVRQADRQARASALDWEVTRQGLAFGVRQSYFTVLENQALLEVSEASLASFEKHLDEAKKLHDVGRRTKIDVTKAEVDVSNAKVAQIQARNALNLSRAQLNKSLGLEEDPGYTLEKDLPLTLFDVPYEEAVAQARRSRPDLSAAKARLDATEEGLRAVWSGYFPKLSLNGNFTASGQTGPLARNWSFGPSLQWNVFSGNLTRRQMEEAEANIRQSRANLASTEQAAYLDVRQNWLNLQEAKERLSLADQTVKQAEENNALAQARYSVGLGTALERTDAQLTLTQAQAERIKARADYEVDVAGLLKAMGLLDKAKEQAR